MVKTISKRKHPVHLVIFGCFFAIIGTILLLQSKAAVNSADFNGDSTVNILDLSILGTNYGGSGKTQAQGDANGDGSVNILDLSVLGTQWGTNPSGGGGGGTTADFYVATTGNDSNNCTQATPCRTIGRAQQVASAGHVIAVKSGTYTPPISITKSNITIKSEVAWGADIDGTNTVPNGFVFGSGVTGVTIEGFEIKNLRSTGGSSSAIELYSGGSGSILKNNNIHSIGKVCTSTSNGQVAIFVKANNVTIENNYIHDLGRLQPSEGCSTGDPNHDHGIYMNSTGSTQSGAIIRNNHFSRIDRGWAIQFYPGAWASTQVQNNTFAYGNPAKQYAHIVIYDMNLNGVSFTGNTFYNTTSSCKPFTLGGSLSFTSVSVTSNQTTCSGLTDTTPPSGWNASSNTLNASLSAPATPTAPY